MEAAGQAVVDLFVQFDFDIRSSNGESCVPDRPLFADPGGS